MAMVGKNGKLSFATVIVICAFLLAVVFVLLNAVESRNKVGSLQKFLDQKTEALSGVEARLKDAENRLALAGSENNKALAELDKQRRALLEQNAELQKKIDEVGKTPSRAGSPADMAKNRPVVMPGPPSETSIPDLSDDDVRSSVVAVDIKNNLIVVGAGRKDNLKKGDSVSIVKSGKEIARGEVIGVRYRAASVFVSTLQIGQTINDIKEGDEAVIVQ